MVAIECCKMDFPTLVCHKLAFLDFESRKDAAQVASYNPRELSLVVICSFDVGNHACPDA